MLMTFTIFNFYMLLSFMHIKILKIPKPASIIECIFTLKHGEILDQHRYTEGQILKAE